MTTALGRGVYTFREAARLIKLRPGRVREWFVGRPSEARCKAIFRSDYAALNGEHAISFLDLIDVFVAGQLRNHGVPLQTVRHVHDRLKTDLGTPHPFCHEELLSDGKQVFLRGLDARGQEQFLEVLTRQKVFPQVLLPFLQSIDYGRVSMLAERWHISEDVVIDPGICFGAPVVQAAGIPTAILAAAYQANGKDAERVADWYAVDAANVLAAVRFERSMAA